VVRHHGSCRCRYLAGKRPSEVLGPSRNGEVQTLDSSLPTLGCDAVATSPEVGLCVCGGGIVLWEWMGDPRVICSPK
jgi:hypothetical protein